MSSAAMTEVGSRSHDQRSAQRAWSETEIAARLRILKRFRHLASRRASAFAEAINRQDHVSTLTAEVLPLLEACRFLERNARKIIAPRRTSRDGRPIWLPGVQVEVVREPLGLVLIIGPSNYPLFLAGVQALQALAAGNAVLLKPGHGGGAVMELFRRTLLQAGLNPALLVVTDDSVESGKQAVASDVDKVILTGSEKTGLVVRRKLASRAIPSVMELSGDDAVFVRPTADIDLVSRAIAFALRLNDGETCIRPHRIFAPPDVAARLEGRVAIPVIAADDEMAIHESQRSGFALGATVFGEPAEAASFARRLNAGVVVINDVIVPTADPRVPFGGRRRSGYGVTRGPEGLLEMTQVKAIVTRRSRWLPHLDPPPPDNEALFTAFIELMHGTGLFSRLRALKNLIGAAARHGAKK